MSIQYTVKKGDTLNSIAQAQGFKNYKDAGITSVPSGNFDLIRPGETINFNQNRVPGIQDTTPLVSSLDDSQGFKNNSGSLDSLLNPQPLPDTTMPEPTDDQNNKNRNRNNQNNKKNPSIGGNETTGDALFDRLNQDAEDAKIQADAQGEEVKREYESLFKSELAAINSRARAATNKINQSFSQRIEEQKRINNVNVDRVRAYGLSSGNAMTVPLAWSDAITERERKGAEEISSLETQRNNLIDQARAARDEGRSDLLAAKIKDIQSAENRLNERLDEIEKESQAQYTLLRKVREGKENELQEQRVEMLAKMKAYFKVNTGEIDGMSPEEKNAKITELSNSYGLEYYEVFGVIEEALAPNFANLEGQLKLDKLTAEVGATEALGRQRDASASASWESAAKTKKQTDQIGTEESENRQFTKSEEDKLEQAGLANATRKVKLDFLHGDDFEKIEAKDSGMMDENDPLGLF